MQCMLQNILKEVIFWALLASGDFHKNEVQCPRKALLGDAWSEILAGLSELGLTNSTVATTATTTDQIVWIEDQEKNSRQHLLFTWFHNFGQPGRHRQKWNLYL